ncbi:MAG: NifB/NifX family molybdenum-iron cluster-binding protein [Desulfobacteraceae bacterium]|jgi:predicted Fe-Mo cluster-binding NifX family protein
MKVALTSKGKTWNAGVEKRFSRSPFFVIVDTQTEELNAFKNPGASAQDAACMDAIKFLVDRGVRAVVTGDVGYNAFVVIRDTPIQVYLGARGSVREAYEKFNRGKLKPAEEPSVGFQEGLQ